MVSKIENLSRLLPAQEEEEEKDTEGVVFDLIYRGSSEIDRHYTKPMLPWIISEIKNQHKLIQVTVTLKGGSFEVQERENRKSLLIHTVKQIHKCVMEQADHRCFLYTLRPLEKESHSQDPIDINLVPTPSNIAISKNYQCHLFQALSEQEVRSFFACLRQQPRECKLQENDSLNSLAELSVHTESQFFEVLFVGRVKVSHCKVPVTFIDEALEAFKRKEKNRQRNVSGENAVIQRVSPSRMMSFQQEGSGYSVPNIVLRNLCGEEHLSSYPKTDIKDSNSGESGYKKERESKGTRVRFHLGDSYDCADSQEDSPAEGLSPQSSVSSCSSVHIQSDLKEIEKEARTSRYSKTHLFKEPGGNTADNLAHVLKKLDSPVNTSESHVRTDSSSGSVVEQLSTIEAVEPAHQRQRTSSICDSISAGADIQSHMGEYGMRCRSGSIGSMLSKNKYTRPSDADLKALGYDFNRTMLFHIGHREIQLINPELKSVQLNKPFKDVAGCCQGMKSNDHFGFICRELCGEMMVYVGYIFRCDKSTVADEIMQVLNRSFSAMHEAHQRDRKEHLMCDFCPLKWFSQLCAEVEGLPAAKAHSVIMKRVSMLPEEEREIIIAKYEGAEISELDQKNNVLMMLLRTHFEYKQMNHSHPSESNYAKSEFLLGTNIESSFKKARKSITTSFNHLLKKREGESAEREAGKPTEEQLRASPTRTASAERSDSVGGQKSQSKANKSSCVLEDVSDSPLKSYRQRSSTVSGACGDSMRKELIARKNIATKKDTEKHVKFEPKQTPGAAPLNSGPKMNIFLKFGSPTSPTRSVEPPEKVCEETEQQNKPAVSFRQTILQKVVSPGKGMQSEPSLRKVSSGLLGKQDREDLQRGLKRNIDDLMIIWKKAIFQQILLLRIERENQRLRAIQKEVALQRVRLNYDEEELPLEAQQAWELLLSRPQARIDSNVLFSGIKHGVPKVVRGEVWNLLMMQQQMFHQAPRQKNIHPKFFNVPYEDMLKELTSQQHAILIDLGRTFPGHPYFTQTLGPGQLALFNILKAYSILDPEVGYCQGLSFVGGVLLLHVEEELAYSLLKYLMFEKGCRKQYRPDLDGLQIRMYQLSRLVHDKLHELYEHLEEHEVTPQLYATPWFLTLFASQFPLNFVSRVFDLLFLLGMEGIFCVALVLLQTNEQILLSLDSFEQIMDYFKSSVPDIQTSQLGSFFAEVCECSVKKELSAYEVEYHVLQEELSFTPQQNANLNKLKESNRNLKRQNIELLEEIQAAKVRQQTLEASNQSLQQSQHHLEVRVRWLELERTNMRQLIQVLCRNAPKEMFDDVPSTLERYLPHKASSPMPEDRQVSHMNSPEGSRRILGRIAKRESPPKEISIQVPRQHSYSPIRTIKEQSPEPAVVTPLPSTAREEFYAESRRPRSSTLDPKSMQNYFRSFIKAE